MKGFALIPLLILGVVMLGAIFLFTTWQKNGTNTDGSKISAYPTATEPSITVSPSVTSTSSSPTIKNPTPTPSSHSISFEIDTILVNPNLSPEKLEFNSVTSEEFSVSKEDNNTAHLVNSGASIYIMAGQGESGGIYEFVPEYQTITNNNMGIELTRIQAEYNLLYFKNKLDESGNSYSYHYYTNDFKTGAGCNSTSLNVSCGTQEIKYKKQNFGVYCVVEDNSKIAFCDEFVKNLNLTD